MLEERGEGRLGVLDAVELVISTRDTESARRRWQRLFDPLRRSGYLTWQPAVGPAITLAQGDGEHVDHLTHAVRSEAVALEKWSEVVPVLGRFPLRFVSG